MKIRNGYEILGVSLVEDDNGKLFLPMKQRKKLEGTLWKSQNFHGPT